MTLPNKPRTPQPKNRMYECKLCHVECNSEFMYQQHVQGSKHKKKVTGSNIDFKVHVVKYRGCNVNSNNTMIHLNSIEKLEGSKYGQNRRFKSWRRWNWQSIYNGCFNSGKVKIKYN